MTDTKKLLAIKYGAMLTLDEVAPYFKCKNGKNIEAIGRRGQFPLPIIKLERIGDAKKTTKAVHVEHLADYIDKMKIKAERIFNSDVKAMES